MNCPSRVDPDALEKGWNQSPNSLALHKNDDLNTRANLTQQRDHRIPLEQPPENTVDQDSGDGQGFEQNVENEDAGGEACVSGEPPQEQVTVHLEPQREKTSYSLEGELAGIGPLHPQVDRDATSGKTNESRESSDAEKSKNYARMLWQKLAKYTRFVGPGFLVSVAYIDPGNYATDVAAGASYRFRLLVMILVSNLIAIFLQSLAIRLGSVTGLNLAENIKVNCPRWLNYILWFFGESAIIATDIAEVLGTAIALNLLIKVPLVAGCAISIVDVLIILAFYRPRGSMVGLRVFECFVMALVIGVAVCFSIMLSLIDVPDVGDLFRGYLPSHALVESQGLYQACGILGATVMPHGLYLGSGLVQSRLQEYDSQHGHLRDDSLAAEDDDNAPHTSISKYRPSLPAIRHCMATSMAELAISLFTFALFVNSAILIVAGATLSARPDGDDADSASLFSIHAVFARSLAPFAGTVFALALLLSGTSAGIVCTIAGQMISEGQLGWSVRPWVRRLITRSISITPSIIVAGAVGKSGVSAALGGSQVALSVILPVTSAPLIWFTCRRRVMTVSSERGGGGGGEGSDGGAGTRAGSGDDEGQPEGEERGESARASERGREVSMSNGRIVSVLAAALWLLIVVMNVALLVLVGLGKA